MHPSCLTDVLPIYQTQFNKNELILFSWRIQNFRIIFVFVIFLNFTQFVIECQALLIFTLQTPLYPYCSSHAHWDCYVRLLLSDPLTIATENKCIFLNPPSVFITGVLQLLKARGEAQSSYRSALVLSCFRLHTQKHCSCILSG